MKTKTSWTCSMKTLRVPLKCDGVISHTASSLLIDALIPLGCSPA